MIKEDKQLKKVLKKLRLQKYYVKFSEEEVVFSDLLDIEEEEIEDIIPKKIHRRRLLKWKDEQKKKKGQKSQKSELKVEEKSSTPEDEEGPFVDFLVKWRKKVGKLHEVPLQISNEELIGRLLQTFMECEVKLQGEEKSLSKEKKRFTLQKWFEKNDMSTEDTVRAVLKVKGAFDPKYKERVEELEEENERLVTGVKEKESIILKKEKIIKELKKTVGRLESTLEKVKLISEEEMLKHLEGAIRDVFAVSIGLDFGYQFKEIENLRARVQENGRREEVVHQMFVSDSSDGDMGLGLFGSDDSD